MKRTDDAILEAAQLIEQHTHYINVHQKEFMEWCGVLNLWEICGVQFKGADVVINYNDTLDSNTTYRVSLHKYCEWRKSK
jgi:hypothetical protein